MGAAGQGSALAISADGNTAAFAGSNDAQAGAVWVFTRTNSVWSQQGAMMVCPDKGGSEVFGNDLFEELPAPLAGSAANRSGTELTNLHRDRPAVLRAFHPLGHNRYTCPLPSLALCR